MTEDDRLDVRSEIGRAASVSTGNVTKVKHLQAQAVPELLEALCQGEISIHRAFGWVKSHPAEEQRGRLADWRKQRRARTTTARLLRRHNTRQEQVCSALRIMREGLKILPIGQGSSEVIGLVDQLVSEIATLLEPTATRHAA